MVKLLVMSREDLAGYQGTHKRRGMATLEEWKNKFKEENPTLSSMIDGVTVPLDEQEYEQTISNWANNAYNQEIDRKLRETGGVSENYAELRNDRDFGYPSVQEQLGMIYDDMANGTTTFVEAIKKIKDKYPKPE